MMLVESSCQCQFFSFIFLSKLFKFAVNGKSVGAFHRSKAVFVVLERFPIECSKSKPNPNQLLANKTTHPISNRSKNQTNWLMTLNTQLKIALTQSSVNHSLCSQLSLVALGSRCSNKIHPKHVYWL